MKARQPGQVGTVPLAAQRAPQGRQQRLDRAMLGGGGVPQGLQQRPAPRRGHDGRGTALQSTAGRVTRQIVPSSAVDVMRTSPWCRATRRLTMNRPSPNPEWRLDRASYESRLNGTKMIYRR